MAVELQRIGYGQVERQHMAAPHNGQIYAQLPAMELKDSKWVPITQLENGQFLKYDYAHGKATTSGDIEWFLVYNEEKLYDERRQNHKDFVMKASDMSDGKIYPRLLRTFVGDVFTTNTFRTEATGSGDSAVPAVTVSGPDQKITTPDLQEGNYVVIDNDGWLVKSATKPASGIVFQVVPHFTQMNLKQNETKPDYTLPDGQWAVKLQRIQ